MRKNQKVGMSQLLEWIHFFSFSYLWVQSAKQGVALRLLSFDKREITVVKVYELISVLFDSNVWEDKVEHSF